MPFSTRTREVRPALCGKRLGVSVRHREVKLYVRDARPLQRGPAALRRPRSWSSTAFVPDPQPAADLLHHLVHDCHEGLNPPLQYFT